MRERDTKILSQAVWALMGENYLLQNEQVLAESLIAADIKAQSGTWPTRDAYEKHVARVDELSPGN